MFNAGLIVTCNTVILQCVVLLLLPDLNTSSTTAIQPLFWYRRCVDTAEGIAHKDKERISQGHHSCVVNIAALAPASIRPQAERCFYNHTHIRSQTVSNCSVRAHSHGFGGWPPAQLPIITELSRRRNDGCVGDAE